MRRCRSLAGLILGVVAVIACKPYQRARRPRANVPSAVTPPEEPAVEAPAPPSAPAEPPRPVARPAKDRSSCGPGGKGPRFVVRGVDPSDTLNVRVAPDPQSEVLGQLLPNTTGVLDLREQQRVGAASWRKVRCGELVGWVNERFLDPQGGAGQATTKRL